MALLLDANVLIALIDPSHIQHHAAHDWFATPGWAAWASCPLTETAVRHIVGHPRYPNSLGTSAAVAPALASLCGLPGHPFWPDDLRLLDPARFDLTRLLGSRQVTDSDLLALAHARGGQSATFDRRPVTDAVLHGAHALHLIH